MSKSITAENAEDIFKSELVDYKIGRIPLDAIDVDFDDWSFRDPEELSDDQINPLAEDIALHGLTTPLLVARLPAGRFRLLNGHRRYKALSLLVRQQVEYFTADMKVRAQIIEEGASELAMLSRAVSANVHQRTFSPLGRQKAVFRLKKLGMPNKEIARVVGVSESTVDRDLALAGNECMLEHVNEGNINGTDAATLVKVAEGNGRVDDLCEALAEFVGNTERAIEAEDRRRKAADEEPLSKADKLPRRYLTAEQIRVWKTALEKGLPLGAPEFRFRAQIKQEKGDRRIIVDKLAVSLNELSAKDTAKLVVRFADLVEALKPVVTEKAKAEEEANRNSVVSERPRAGRRLLESLGVEHLLDEGDNDDEPFDVEINLNDPAADHTDGVEQDEGDDELDSEVEDEDDEF